MIWSYSFLPEAQLEYEDAVRWYLSKSQSAAEKFVEAVEETLGRIIEHPTRWRNEFSVFRELGLKKFPYSIIYMLAEDARMVVVSSVHHHRRHPDTKYPTA